MRELRKSTYWDPSESTHKVEIGSLAGLLGYQIRQAQTALFREFSSITASLQVSPGEFSLLTLIDANPGVSQTGLTSLYRVDKSTISLSISELAKRGIINRTRSESDNRYYELSLTESGHQLLKLVSARVDAQERVMDALLRSGERQRLLEILSKIAVAFDR